MRNCTLDSPIQPHSGISQLNSTLFDVNQSDVTGTVNMSNPGAVAAAICTILAPRYEDFDEVILLDGFLDLEDIFWVRQAVLLPFDTPYPALPPSSRTALALSRS